MKYLTLSATLIASVLWLSACGEQQQPTQTTTPGVDEEVGVGTADTVMRDEAVQRINTRLDRVSQQVTQLRSSVAQLPQPQQGPSQQTLSTLDQRIQQVRQSLTELRSTTDQEFQQQLQQIERTINEIETSAQQQQQQIGAPSQPQQPGQTPEPGVQPQTQPGLQPEPGLQQQPSQTPQDAQQQ